MSSSAFTPSTNYANAATPSNEGLVNTGAQTFGGDKTFTGNFQVAPPNDYWTTGSIYTIQGLGQLETHGSFSVSLTSNGYRSSGSLWTSYGANSQSGAAQIELLPSGSIRFRTEASKPTGSSSTITQVGSIDSAGKWILGPTGYTGTHDINGKVSIGGVALEFNTGTATVSGFSGTVTVELFWTKIGNYVTLSILPFSGTSTTTAMSFTLPTAIRPATGAGNFPVYNVGVTNNGTLTTGGRAQVLSASGTIDLRTNSTGGDFTASGTKGLSQSVVIAYSLV